MQASPGQDRIEVTFLEDDGINRLWGIPLLGVIVRMLLAIPLYIGSFLLGIGAYLAVLVLWIPVLLAGRQVDLAYTIVGGYLRYSVRILAYVYLLGDRYPPFSLAEQPDEDVTVHIPRDQRINRLWGIPILGYVIRFIIVIPHVIVVVLWSVAAGFTLWFTWIPVLLNGSQAGLVYAAVGGYLRYYVRVSAYLLLLTDDYPPLLA